MYCPSLVLAVAAVGLLWNLTGCVFFGRELFAQEAMIDSMSDSQKDWVRSIPSWIYFVYGVAVGTGVAGSVCLFMRRASSVLLFGVCLTAVLVHMIYTMIISGGLQVMGPSGLVMPSVVTILAGIFFLVSCSAKKKSWLE